MMRCTAGFGSILTFFSADPLSSPVGWKQSVDIFRSNLYWNRDSGQDQGDLKTVVYYKITRSTTLKLKKSTNIITLGLNEKYKINWN